jgi:hypothetical protein
MALSLYPGVDPPAFFDVDGVLARIVSGTRAPEEFRNGQWVPSKDPIRVTHDGYRLTTAEAEAMYKRRGGT